MKTKEFIKRVEELGFKVNRTVAQIDIIARSFTIAKVYTNRRYSINTFNFVNIEWENQDKLFDLIVEYAMTPIEDREEEKKFYLRHMYFKNWNDRQYFTFDYIHKCVYVRSKLSTCRAMQQFTEKEIEKIKEKYNTDLKDFELVEVKE